MTGVVIVGAGLGGLRAAESLRSAGHAGAITIVGDEPHLPYNRPPLSKEALSAGVDIAGLEFRRKDSVDDVHWQLGAAAVASDLGERTVTLADGTNLAFDGLVIASGIRPRSLPIPGPTKGRIMLRTAADATALRERLMPGSTIVIMGAGFIGCEVAATAATLGATVHVVALDAEPMIRPLGAELGAAMRRRHAAHGIHFHLGHTIDRFLGDDHVTGAELSDGTVLPADVVLEAVGSVPNVEWLDGNGLDLSDGIEVDAAMVVRSAPAPVVAVGDVARHPNALFPGASRRIEHWNMPTETARRAGPSLAALLRGDAPSAEPFTAMPAFWSDQYAHTIQSFGMPGLASSITVADGTVDAPCIVTYHDDSGLVGVVGIDRTADLAPYRRQLMGRTPAASA
ncbi:MAG: FAD-dependent oxidoreductase [Actinomycetales bacterium]|nr:FAD-dependent oxidoreductase [Actinomycetales bacterium]